MFSAQSPFERLRNLLADTPPGAPPIDLTIGNPQHPPPAFIGEIVARHAGEFVGYPPIAGTANLRRAVHDYCDRRFGLDGFLRESGDVLPLNGSREGLFLAAFTARDILGKRDPAILFANPFYQAYPSAAHALGAQAVPVAARPGTLLPDLESLAPDVLDRAVAYYIGSPSNPEGHVASEEDWLALFDLAARHDIFLFADECYSDIYREAAGPPLGALRVARSRPEALERLFVFNSLSKRSNLAGLRVGFVAGGKGPIGAMREFRNQVGPQVTVPLLEAAAAALDDEEHVAHNRRLYDEKYADAQEILGPLFGNVVPPAGFFLWLPFGGDDAATALALWRDYGVRTVPGSYLTAPQADGSDPGRGHLRLALVSERQKVAEALSRVAAFAAARAEPVAG